MVRIFPNPQACLRLVSALAVEQSEEWVTGRRYLDMEELREQRRSEEREKNGMMLMEIEETSVLEEKENTELSGLDQATT